MGADLLTYNEYLAAVGKAPADLDTSETTRIEWAISAASDAIRSYTDRDFTLNVDAVQGTRTYRYYGHGTLDIDDATSVITVGIAPQTFSFGRTLESFEYFVSPMESTIFTYIEFFTRFVSRGISPEMGFKQNLDQYPFIPYPVEIQVNAVWGWPEVPKAVKMAAVWGTANFIADPSPYAAEAIAGYSRSYQRTAARGNILPGQTIQSLPDRAIALLDPYTRILV